MLLPSPEWLNSGNNAWQSGGCNLCRSAEHFRPNHPLWRARQEEMGDQFPLSLNKLQTSALMKKADDTLDVFSTHGVAGLMGGLLTGGLANPDMLLYVGTDKDAPGVNATGWLYGNSRSSNCRRMPRVISSCLTRSRPSSFSRSSRASFLCGWTRECWKSALWPCMGRRPSIQNHQCAKHCLPMSGRLALHR